MSIFIEKKKFKKKYLVAFDVKQLFNKYNVAQLHV